jgi:virulence factor Mce-like protein
MKRLRSLSRLSPVTRPIGGLLSLLAIAAAAVTLVRLGNGDFSSAYVVSASFPTASAGLHPGSQVVEQGVQVGSVRQITLQNGRALVSLGIASRYKIPADATATIEPENLFGADQVAISVPAGSDPTANPLPPGGQIRHTRVLAELGQLFSSADPLLSKIDTADLATTVNELAAAYGGQGRQIAASLEAGARLTSLLAQTMPAQLAALDAFTRFSVTIQGEGPTFNQLAFDGNRTMPLFDAAERAYARLLSDLGTFSDQLATLMADYRPQINTMLNQGDNVIRVLLAQRQNVAQLVQGLATYAYKFAHGASSARLPDGTRFGYFKTFIVWPDVQKFVCSLIAPAQSGLSFLKPLQQAVLSGNTFLDCKNQLAAFDAAQGGSSSPVVPVQSGSARAGSSSGSSGTSNALGGITSAGRQAANAIYGAIGQPQSSPNESVGSYVDSLLPVYPVPQP